MPGKGEWLDSDQMTAIGERLICSQMCQIVGYALRNPVKKTIFNQKHPNNYFD
jgi:hypothetical protein